MPNSLIAAGNNVMIMHHKPAQKEEIIAIIERCGQNDFERKLEFPLGKCNVKDMFYQPDLGILGYLREDGVVESIVFDLNIEQFPVVSLPIDFSVKGLYHDQEKQLLYLYNDNKIIAINLQTKLVEQEVTTNKKIDHCIVTPGGGIIVGHEDGTIALFNQSWREIAQHESKIDCLFFADNKIYCFSVEASTIYKINKQSSSTAITGIKQIQIAKAFKEKSQVCMIDHNGVMYVYDELLRKVTTLESQFKIIDFVSCNNDIVLQTIHGNLCSDFRKIKRGEFDFMNPFGIDEYAKTIINRNENGSMLYAQTIMMPECAKTIMKTILTTPNNQKHIKTELVNAVIE